MWFERFVIIVTSLHRDFLPSSWAYFSPTFWDVACLLGSFAEVETRTFIGGTAQAYAVPGFSSQMS